MSIALVVTRGYGNGTYNGTIGDVVTRGYTSQVAVSVPPPIYKMQLAGLVRVGLCVMICIL